MGTVHKLETKKSEKKITAIQDLPGYEKHMEGTVQKKNIAYQETAMTVNEDGEILQQSFKTVSRATEGDFIKLYLSDIAYVHRLEKNQQELLYYFLRLMTYDNMIIINKTIKERVAKESGKAYSTVENALVSYTKSGIFLKEGRGVYIANPYLFGKGKFEDIQKIRTEIIYTADGIKLRSQIEKRDEHES